MATVGKIAVEEQLMSILRSLSDLASPALALADFSETLPRHH